MEIIGKLPLSSVGAGFLPMDMFYLPKAVEELKSLRRQPTLDSSSYKSAISLLLLQ